MYQSSKTEGTAVTYGQFVKRAKTTQAQLGRLITPLPTGKIKTFEETDSNVSDVTQDSVSVTPQDSVVNLSVDTAPEAVTTQAAQSGSSMFNVFLAAANATTNQAAATVPPNLSAVQGQVSQALVAQNTPVASAVVVPNITTALTIAGSTHKTPEEIKKALEEAAKLELAITWRSRKSEVLEFNNLKVPKLEVKLVYNFFVEDEEDIDVQEDQSLDPLLDNRPVDVPRYVDVRWGSFGVTEVIEGSEDAVRENAELRHEIFARRVGEFGVGSSNFSYSPAQAEKLIQPTLQDGVEKRVVDIHEPTRALNSVVNPKVFKNSVRLTTQIEDQPSVIDQLPAADIVEG